ncbi:unnamed protein product [Linum trigynum]|uniref:Uncharacterized protein n=1 Tax=Linum trigynum TaxID=586398 RepID=A0AAV2DXM3_9ROSI
MDLVQENQKNAPPKASLSNPSRSFPPEKFPPVNVLFKAASSPSNRPGRENNPPLGLVSNLPPCQGTPGHNVPAQSSHFRSTVPPSPSEYSTSDSSPFDCLCNFFFFVFCPPVTYQTHGTRQ